MKTKKAKLSKILWDLDRKKKTISIKNEFMDIRKVKVGDLRKLKAGETKVFYVPHIRDIRTAQSIIYRVQRFEPELGVTFSTVSDYDNLTITVTATKI
jgi:hypothetical protein